MTEKKPILRLRSKWRIRLFWDYKVIAKNTCYLAFDWYINANQKSLLPLIFF